MIKKYLRLYLGLFFLFLTILIQFAARCIPGFATWYAHHIYPVLVGILGRFSGLFPVSLTELGLYGLIVWLLIDIVRSCRKRLMLLAKWFCIASALLFSYTVNCGVNYFASPFSEYAGLETGLYTKEELKELCQYLVEQVNTNVSEIHYADQRLEWKQEGVRAMQNLGKEFACLSGFYPMPKDLLLDELLSFQQLCGVYTPFTIEANFNGDMPDYNIPHTICHELSHLKGFMYEDEANFIGYLACIGSENQAFRYSGYLTGWVYAGNALAKADWDAFLELHSQLDERTHKHLQENNDFWDQFEGKVAEAANQMNDTYLKINRQEDGVKSYGRMVDLMLAHRKKETK